MRYDRIVSAIVPLLIVFTSQVQAATLDDRVKAVENKTANFVVVKKTTRRTFTNVRVGARDRIAKVLYSDLSLTSVGPAIANAWITISGTYRSTAPFLLDGAAGIKDSREGGNPIDIDVQFCNVHKDFPNSNGQPVAFSINFFCLGAANPQHGQRFRAAAFINPTEAVDFDTLTIDTKITLQDQIEPP